MIPPANSGEFLPPTNEQMIGYLEAEIVYLRGLLTAERTSCAALVRDAGCLCAALFAVGIFNGHGQGKRIRAGGEELDILETVDRHDDRCPQSLADKIEGLVT